MPQYRPAYRNPSNVWVDCETVGISYANLYHPLNINLRETNNMNIPGIPSGWKPVAFREAEPTEYFVDSSGSVCMDMLKRSLSKWVIVERIIELREGKYYKQRNGEYVVGPMIPCNQYFTAINGRVYERDGKDIARCSGTDLVECVDPPKPKYRPIKDAKEFKELANVWFTNKESKANYRALVYGDYGVVFCVECVNKHVPYTVLIEDYTMQDGNPAGIRNS